MKVLLLQLMEVVVTKDMLKLLEVVPVLELQLFQEDLPVTLKVKQSSLLMERMISPWAMVKIICSPMLMV